MIMIMISPHQLDVILQDHKILSYHIIYILSLRPFSCTSCFSFSSSDRSTNVIVRVLDALYKSEEG
jgi:hypothetical protein